ncbi:MAG: hypothetical protein KDD64_02540 [Bdellovibrionales bacterium]|nr:hypothetical protein [Bdellovibrionales bacterium]
MQDSIEKTSSSSVARVISALADEIFPVVAVALSVSILIDWKLLPADDARSFGLPEALAVLVLFSSFFCFVSVVRGSWAESTLDAQSLLRTVFLLVVAAIALFGVPYFGLYLSGGLLHVLLLIACRVRVPLALSLAFGWAIFGYCIFEKLLLIPIPHGSMW